jgi:hypothetical protein
MNQQEYMRWMLRELHPGLFLPIGAKRNGKPPLAIPPAIRWLLLTSTILAGCAAPAGLEPTLTLTPPVPKTVGPLPTLDEKLNAMILETSGQSSIFTTRP